ncbi:MAG: hypothetical protein JRF71_08530 [Deltaproteobacteria bacterium]|nr:hypothetical protein [Deltaproteobacteria bacterium]
MFFKNFILIIATVCAGLFSACGPKTIMPQATLDSPRHHVSNGQALLANEKINAAFYEFNRAKELDPKYAPAYVGLGLVAGFRGNFENGLTNIKDARKYAQGNEQKVAVDVAHMRIYIMGGDRLDKSWLDIVENKFNRARNMAPDAPEPYFFMGRAYQQANDFTKAKFLFQTVIDLDNGYVHEAEAEYATIR